MISYLILLQVYFNQIPRKINDNNNWGCVGSYRRFRSHAIKEIYGHQILGLPRDYY